MTITAETKQGITHLAIQDDMTIYSALELRDMIAHHLHGAREIRVDLAQVTEMDSAGLQILLWLKQETLQKHIALTLVSHSKAVVEILELLNLTGFFGDPVVISANWKQL